MRQRQAASLNFLFSRPNRLRVTWLLGISPWKFLGSDADEPTMEGSPQNLEVNDIPEAALHWGGLLE